MILFGFTPTRRWLGGIALLALSYYVAARVGLLFAFSTTNATPVWPPSGIAMAAILIGGWRMWPGVALGALAANIAVFAANGVSHGPSTMLVALAIATGNTLEALLGRLLLRRVMRVPGTLDRPSKVYRFVATAGLMSLVAASIGTASLIIGGVAPMAAAPTIFVTWWLGDTTGVAVVAPLLMSWRHRVRAWPAPRWWLEAGTGVVMLLTLLWFVFGQHSGAGKGALAYWLLPAIGWAAYRYDKRGVTLVLLLVAGSAVWGTTHGLGPFAAGTLNGSLLALETYVVLCSVIGLVLAADMEQRGQAARAGARRTTLIHWMTLFICLALTIFAWHLIASSTEQRARERFDAQVESLRQRIDERMDTYEQVLRAAQGLYAASKSVERDEWAAFTQRLDLEHRFPGMVGVGAARLVRAADVDAFTSATRADGAPDFRIWPPGQRATYAPVIYLEPTKGGNRGVVGFDLLFEGARRAAALHAGASGETAITPKLVLVQDGVSGTAPGFLMVLPVYRNGQSTATEAQRLAALEGFVLSPFRMHDLLRGLQIGATPELRLEVFDGKGLDPADLMFSSTPGQGAAADYPNPIMKTGLIDIADRVWTLRATSLPAFEASVDRQKSLIVLFGGAMISLLLFGVVRALAGTREEAVALAAQMGVAFRDSERKFALLIDSAREFAIIGTDTAGRIQSFNSGAERMLGYSADEVLDGRTIDFLHLPEELAERARQLSAELDRPVSGFDIFREVPRLRGAETREWTYVRKDGSELPVQLTVTLITDGEDTVVGALGIAHDITEQKRAEYDLRAAKEQAELANRAKSDFVANMSHELRTPMNAVLGMTYLLSNTALSPEQKKDVEMIRASGQSLLGILNDILDFSKIEAGKMTLAPERFRLDDVLTTLATIISTNSNRHELELSIGVDPALPQLLLGDALRLQQILVNLTGNAIKFTEHGEVALTVARVPSAGALMLRFTVRDTGIGMSDAQQRNLYSPFTQADTSTTRRFGGTGLGLTISRRLVQLMGGAIAVDSTPDNGTEFRIDLPFDVVAADAAQAPPTPLRLLVLDPHPSARACLRDAATAQGWVAEMVATLDEACALLNAALATGTRYSAILAGGPLAASHDPAALAALRASAPITPIVMLVNGATRAHEMQTGGEHHADAYLAKPVTGGMLAATLGALLGTGGDAPAHTEMARQLSGHLLLVEDNLLNQAVARGILELAGATVDVVDNGQAAVDLLREHASSYALVLMDVQMPGMDGFEATRIIRNELKLALPILAMTAGVLPSERAQCIASGMDDFIAKPIDVAGMIATIKRHLGTTHIDIAPAVTGDPADGVFDIAHLLALTRENPEFSGMVNNLLRKAIATAPDELEAARVALAADQPKVAAAVFHTLRGSIGNFGAKRLVAASHAIEDALRSGDTTRLASQYEQVEQELLSTLAAARAWLDANGG